MHRVIVGLLLVLGAMALGALGVSQFAGFAQAQEGERSIASVAVHPPVAELHTSTNLVVLGAAFRPEQEIRILLGDAFGNLSDITDWLNPGTAQAGTVTLKTDKNGNFAGRFPMGAFERVGAEAAWGITVTDASYKALATTPLVLCDPRGRSQVNVYPQGAPDYVKNPKDPRPAPYCAASFKYPERPKS
jgi:hypothetical protein